MAQPPTKDILGAVGHTPVIRLNHVVPPNSAEIYIKLEFLNPTGSYKDRMAKSIIEEAERRGDLKPGMTIVEATGGSTGSSLAFICAAKKYPFTVVSSNAFALEKLRTMEALGATLDIVPSAEGITPSLFPTMLKRAKELAQGDEYYFADQFNNRDASVGYEGIGQELLEQFPGGIDAFCGAVGGAGMVMGVSKVLKAKWPGTHVAVLEPASSPAITEGRSGKHSVEGIGIGFVPPHLDRSLYDEARAVQEEEARSMCRRLAREEGLLVGTSTGLNVVAAIDLAKRLGPGKTVVTVAVDTGLKYINGNLFTE
ncbi:pyridoxal phosphate-dependent enzyme, beta subunit [Aspergillus sclerotioniger CBS 115572]|uniref:Pyridoxal phosphate-dependent enzyme, beta subunit n=1 Tax=Aspergillus sclerotioniger CBS 115572 TaxID=1450535 RepID=A0A317XAE7_9EURO|nr:pyridoxal phosphate-dependent enzyme, beta subunit [Aspergillus sclerotioniger CBS 115572]PWY95375.1 pyridoxal phosphate-dependent enzyme, beta subunit [Aspergillus sclerotioniger CBS 115572]